MIGYNKAYTYHFKRDIDCSLDNKGMYGEETVP